MAETVILQQPQPRTVLFQANYDKEIQRLVEQRMPRLIGSIRGYCIEMNSNWITEPEALAPIMSEIEAVLQLMKNLYLKYHEDLSFIHAYETELSNSIWIDGDYTITRLKELQDREITEIAVKHKLMDRIDEKEAWDEIIKKKFWLNQVKGFDIHEAYAKTIYPEWKRLTFYKTAYMVLLGGDIVQLNSGINNSGKTNLSICELWQANTFLRDYWHVSKVTEGWQELDKFSLRKNVFYYPDPSQVSEKVSESTQYNTIDINEGMKAAVNLKSWDPETIDMINDLFTERSKHNFVIFEYQASKRPPKMLLTRFNVWEHKMGPQWMVVSMPSSLYRTEDPMYMNELDKIKGDRLISRWFTHRSGNSNLIDKFKAPRLKTFYEKQFDAIKKDEKERYERGKKIRKTINNVWYTFVQEMHDKVRIGEIAYMELRGKLETRGLKPHQIDKFMKDYEGIDRNYHILHPKKAEEEED